MRAGGTSEMTTGKGRPKDKNGTTAVPNCPPQIPHGIQKYKNGKVIPVASR
jgi:nitrate reductase cytochrome c-type subunit